MNKVKSSLSGEIPLPILLKVSPSVPPILGVGAELKNSFCFLRNGQAFLSQHIGDLNNAELFSFFQENIRKFKSLLACEPKFIAHDLHPDYLSTQWAKENNSSTQLVPVQHHHAHIASVLAEHQLNEPVIGVAMDGTGLGLDGTIWGSEFLVMKGDQFQRKAHLRNFPLPGGDLAAREIWRSAFGLVAETLGTEIACSLIPPEKKNFKKDFVKMLKNKILSPRTSSMGRLFDAVAALISLRTNASFEAQAAMELEALAESNWEKEAGTYTVEIVENNKELLIEPAPLLQEILQDKKLGVSKEQIAVKFHRWVIDGVVTVVKKIFENTGIKTAALSGGCFQNKILLENAMTRLTQSGFKVVVNERVTANDGGIALGQVWVAAKILEKENVFGS